MNSLGSHTSNTTALQGDRGLRGENGSVLLEAAISGAALIGLLIAMIDIGILLHNYILLTQVTSEGARFASRTPQLEEGLFKTSNDEVPVAHNLIHNRVLIAAQIQNRLTNLTDLTVSSEYIAGAEDRVRVVVEGEFSGFFPLFNGLRLVAEHTSAYLVGTDA